MTRRRCVTTKVRTAFVSLYVHVSFTKDDFPIEVWFSSPGKFRESEVGNALILLGEAVTETLEEAHRK